MNWKHLAAASVAFALSASAIAHDGDLKYLHRKPAYAGPGYRNALLRTPADIGPSGQLASTSFPANRVTLLSWLSLTDFGVPSGGNGNSLWGYTSPSGRRYALMGLSTGTAFVEITQPNNPVIVAQRTGPTSLWRDIRVFQNYAYAISEGGSGIQVFNLSQIDAGIVTLANTISDDGVAATHTVVINEQTGYLYRSGGGQGGSVGLRIYNLNASPTNPPRVATWSDRYVHEASVFNYTTGPWAGREIVFACGGFNNGFNQTGLHVLDVTNKASIQTLDIAFYPNAQYCHQGWLSDDGQYFYIDDELWVGNCTTHVMNVGDLANVTYNSSYSNGNTSAAHNLYVYQGKIYSSNYRSGLRVWDVSQNPLSPSVYAYFDTWPEDDIDEFNGLWNNYPFFGNGLVIGSDIEKGLFVWYVGDPRLTIALPSGAPTVIDPAGQSFPVQIQELVAGNYQSGSAMLHYDTGSGFVSVPLTNVGGLNFTAAFPAIPCGTAVSYYVSGDSTDGIVWTDPPGAPSSVHEAVSAAGLANVIDDHFQTDLGWTPTVVGATAGNWQRGVPVNDATWDYDPASDSDGSGQCWLTQNALGNTDVDNGSVVLTSPTLNLTGGDVQIRYDYYLRLTDTTGGADRLLVELNGNNGVGAWTEIARHDTDGGLAWRSHAISQAALDLAGATPTATTRIRFTANDAGTQSIVESGVDAFRIDIAQCGAGTGFCYGDGSGTACPCANVGATGNGCDNSAATGGVHLVGTGDPALNTVVLHGTGFPPAGQPTVLVIRSTTPAATPTVFGDGILCIDPPIVRMAAATASGGQSTHPLNHGAGPGTFHYQLWYRNTANFCTPDPFNLSNAYSIVFP